MRLSSSSRKMATARISRSDNSLNFLAIRPFLFRPRSFAQPVRRSAGCVAWDRFESIVCGSRHEALQTLWFGPQPCRILRSPIEDRRGLEGLEFTLRGGLGGL